MVTALLGKCPVCGGTLKDFRGSFCKCTDCGRCHSYFELRAEETKVGGEGKD
jgi:hypothetical protein